MRLKKTEFIIDSAGNKKSVIIDYDDFIKLMNVIEDIEDSKKIKKTLNDPEITLSAYKRKRGIV